jgi:putative transcriptional regulator
MIYNRIALLRTEQGMSRQELADIVGVNYQTIGFIERGDYSPSLELAFKIAEAFDVALTVVFSDKEFEPLFTHNKDKETK